MSAKTDLVDYCEKHLPKLDEEQFAVFISEAGARPLSDFNVGQVFTLDGAHYLVPNPPTSTHAEFHDLRQKWQAEESA